MQHKSRSQGFPRHAVRPTISFQVNDSQPAEDIRTYVHFAKARPPPAHPVAEDAVPVRCLRLPRRDPSRSRHRIEDALGEYSLVRRRVLTFVEQHGKPSNQIFRIGDDTAGPCLKVADAVVKPERDPPTRLRPRVRQEPRCVGDGRGERGGVHAERLEQALLDKVSVGRVGVVGDEVSSEDVELGVCARRLSMQIVQWKLAGERARTWLLYDHFSRSSYEVRSERIRRTTSSEVSPDR